MSLLILSVILCIYRPINPFNGGLPLKNKLPERQGLGFQLPHSKNKKKIFQWNVISVVVVISNSTV